MKTSTAIRALGLLAVTAVGVTLTSCSAPAPTPTESGADEPVTLTISMLSSNKVGLDLVIADFEKEHPNITVEPSYYEAGDAYISTVPTQFAAGNGTDMVQVLGGTASPYSTGAFAAAGYLTDLTDAAWVPSMYEPTKSLFEEDGRVLAKDFGMAPLSVMSYNKDFFSDNKLKVPTTFDGLLDLCGDISALGVVPISWAAASQPVNANNLATIAGNSVFAEDPDWLTERLDGDTTFEESDGWRRALEQLKEMIDGGCFSPGAGGVALADMLTAYGSGQTAMMFTSGQLNSRVLAEAPDLNIGMFPFPGDKAADTRLTVQASGGIAVWTGSKNIDAANTFLDFLAGDDVSSEFAASNSIITAAQANSGDLPDAYSELEKYFTTEGLILKDVTAQWPNTQMNAQNGASIQGLFTGQKTVDDVLKDMDTYFEE